VAATKLKPKRPTSQEIQEREDLAFDLLSRCYHKSQIKKHFKEKYSCDARTVERYLSRARKRMDVQAAQGKSMLRAESFAFYSSVLRDNRATPREKILARERIDKLYGLDAPVKIKDVTEADRLKDRAKELAEKYGKPVDEVLKDLASRKPELATLLIQ